MTFFGTLRGSPMAMMFVLVSLLNAYYGWRVLGNLRSSWATLNHEPLRRDLKRLIDQAAFFLGVPLGVIIHELGHAVTVVLFGGEIVDAGYGFYWGYVSHTGYYTPVQLWIIAMAGTIGTLLYGITAWLVIRRSSLSSHRYFAMRLLRVHLYYSLVFYPIFTLLTQIGDWEIIYDFDMTPVLSAITLVIHLAILAAFYYRDHQGIFDMPGFDSLEEQAQFEQLKAQVSRTPQDPSLQLRLVDAYRKGGARHLANRQLKSYIKDNPNSAEGFLALAVLQSEGKRQVTSAAKDNALKALMLGLSNPLSVVHANRLAGDYYLNVGKYAAAGENFSQGILAARSIERPDLVAHLYYQRAVAYRRLQKYDQAFRDIEQAIELARQTGQVALLSHYESELSTLRNHSGRSFIS